jgi:hypothetical protein
VRYTDGGRLRPSAVFLAGRGVSAFGRSCHGRQELVKMPVRVDRAGWRPGPVGETRRPWRKRASGAPRCRTTPAWMSGGLVDAVVDRSSCTGPGAGGARQSLVASEALDPLSRFDECDTGARRTRRRRRPSPTFRSFVAPVDSDPARSGPDVS